MQTEKISQTTNFYHPRQAEHVLEQPTKTEPVIKDFEEIKLKTQPTKDEFIKSEDNKEVNKNFMYNKKEV